jgi:hypothetical protein
MHCLDERPKKIKIIYFLTTFDFLEFFLQNFFWGVLHQAVRVLFQKNDPNTQCLTYHLTILIKKIVNWRGRKFKTIGKSVNFGHCIGRFFDD